MSFAPLENAKDGVDAVDNVIADGWQFAITRGGDVMRRPAAEAGRYGGWRYECSVAHCVRFPLLFPTIAVRYAPLIVGE